MCELFFIRNIFIPEFQRVEVSGKRPLMLGVASDEHELRWLHKKLDVLFAHLDAVDVDLLDAAVEAYIYMLPLAFEHLHVLPSCVLVPSVVVHHAAARLCTVHEHDLLELVMGRCEIGYTFVESDLLVEDPCLEGIWSIVAYSSRHCECRLEYLLSGEMDTELAFSLLHDGRSATTCYRLEISAKRSEVVESPVESVAGSEFISADVHEKALLVPVSHWHAYDVGLEVIFCLELVLLPVVLAEICHDELLCTAAYCDLAL